MPYSPKASDAPPEAVPRVRPRWCLRWATLRGINMSNSSGLRGETSVLTSEVRRLVGVVGPPSDVLFLVEQLLQLEVGFLDQRSSRLRLLGGTARRARYHPARLGGLSGRLADGHRRLADDLV